MSGKHKAIVYRVRMDAGNDLCGIVSGVWSDVDDMPSLPAKTWDKFQRLLERRTALYLQRSDRELQRAAQRVDAEAAAVTAYVGPAVEDEPASSLDGFPAV